MTDFEDLTPEQAGREALYHLQEAQGLACGQEHTTAQTHALIGIGYALLLPIVLAELINREQRASEPSFLEEMNEPHSCSVCGKPTRLVAGGYWLCRQHRDEWLAAQEETDGTDIA